MKTKEQVQKELKWTEEQLGKILHHTGYKSYLKRRKDCLIWILVQSTHQLNRW